MLNSVLQWLYIYTFRYVLTIQKMIFLNILNKITELFLVCNQTLTYYVVTVMKLQISVNT